jgi:hypothetical protein
MNTPLPVGCYTNIFTVCGLPVLVQWNADERRIYVAGQFVERDVDVFSEHFFNDLDRLTAEYEKARAELMAEPV